MTYLMRLTRRRRSGFRNERDVVERPRRRCQELSVLTLMALVVPLPSIAAASATETAEPSAQSVGTADEDCAGSLTAPPWETKEPRPPWAGQMPEPQDTGVRRIDAEVDAANGDRIYARVFLPDAYKVQPLPTVLELWHASAQFYGGVLGLCDIEPAAVFLVRRGYAVVIADIPGTGNSTGCWDLGGPAEQQAGNALVNWIAGQGWSNGAVAMRGESGAALSQFATAATRPVALKATIPISPTPPYETFHTGAVTMEQRGLTAYLFGLQAAPATNPTSPDYSDTLVEVACPADYAKWNDPEGTLDAYWRQHHLPLLAARSNAAVMTTVGSPFKDPVHIGWDGMWRALEANAVPRKGFVGSTWGHQAPTIPNWPLHELRWFEHWLKGNDTGVMAEPPLTLVDQADDQRLAAGFPTEIVSWHASAGRLGGPPQKGTATYTDIPGAPQSILREGGGSLDYISEPVTMPIRFSGAGRLVLSASIDTTDTDFAVIVYDRSPGDNIESPEDDILKAITWGYLDARHRKAIDQPGGPVLPDAVEQYRVQLAGTEWTLPVGHSLQLYLASSDGCTPATSVVGPEPFTPPCSEIGTLRSDGSRAKVTIHEGPGLTRLEFPYARSRTPQ
ncbi:MAG TPA: CocE/NonD family hydrolase [Nitriliruptorales bacterium]|nr:CocE/NonD family hydrolase [Nitriliruptorales bacterium]